MGGWGALGRLFLQHVIHDAVLQVSVLEKVFDSVEFSQAADLAIMQTCNNCKSNKAQNVCGEIMSMKPKSQADVSG